MASRQFKHDLVFMTVFFCVAAVGYLALKEPVREAQSLASTAKTVPASEAVGSGLSALPGVEIDFQKARLGETVFRDARLSHDNKVSCSTCHNLEGYGADSQSFSIGIGNQKGDANTPTIFNSAMNYFFFWDGRAVNLKDQVVGPIHNPKEMASNWSEVLQKLGNDEALVSRFKETYGSSPTIASLTDALVQFQRSLMTPNSPFDRYLAGDMDALDESAQRGLSKFESFGCASCHQGTNLGGNMFQTMGIQGNYFKDRAGSFKSDAGRFAVTGNEADRHVFRVPSLRNVEKTAPYFHDGQTRTLEGAVRIMAKYQLGRELNDGDVKDLVAFLNSLTGERPKILTDERGVTGEK